MKKNRNILALVLVGFMLFSIFGCSKSVKYPEYVKYLQNPENGLVQEVVIGGIRIKMKYLPIDYQVYNELQTYQGVKTAKVVDSIKQTYKSSVAFLMNIGPTDEQMPDITKFGVKDYKEFGQRIMDMSFEIGSMTSLEIGEQEIAPDVSQMERNYGLSKTSNILFVFNKKNEKGKDEDLVFIYKDEIFSTGINKFRFKSKDIKNIPSLIFE